MWILRHFALEGLLVFGVTATAAFWGAVLKWIHSEGRLTISHIIGIWMVATGTIMAGVSYYLAYRGITSNLETLSKYALTEIVAGAGGYFLKSGVENTAATVTSNKQTRDM